MKLSISKNCHEILFILRSLFIYFFRSQRSQSQLRINYQSEQVTSNKLSPFRWISSEGKLETIAQSIPHAEARARNGLEHRLSSGMRVGMFKVTSRHLNPECLFDK